jgi:hypothetical protein
MLFQLVCWQEDPTSTSFGILRTDSVTNSALTQRSEDLNCTGDEFVDQLGGATKSFSGNFASRRAN